MTYPGKIAPTWGLGILIIMYSSLNPFQRKDDVFFVLMIAGMDYQENFEYNSPSFRRVYD